MKQLESLISSQSLLIKSTSLKSSFEFAISKAVDNSLSSLGNISKQIIYGFLEESYRIKKEDIALKIEDFHIAIEQTFGAGAKIIEARIIEILHEKYKDFIYIPPNGELNIIGFVSKLRIYVETKELQTPLSK